MNTAPIVLFAYNRPEMLEKTLISLSQNDLADQSVLTIFADGPKAGASEQDLQNIERVRTIAKKQAWCKEVKLIAAPENKGLARSVMEGVSETLKTSDRIIVIEDDVLLSRHFLKFMNAALHTYIADDRVLSIGSWNYFAPSEELKGNFFLRYPDSIAWATFARSWNLFEPNGQLLLDQLKQKGLIDRFNADGKLTYFENMLQQQIDGKIDSWAIRWTATSVLNGKLNFYPRYSLSKHIGFGLDATHENNSSDYNADLKLAEKEVLLESETVIETKQAFRYWQQFIQKLMGLSFKNRLKKSLRKLIPDGLVHIYHQRKKHE